MSADLLLQHLIRVWLFKVCALIWTNTVIFLRKTCDALILGLCASLDEYGHFSEKKWCSYLGFVRLFGRIWSFFRKKVVRLFRVCALIRWNTVHLSLDNGYASDGLLLSPLAGSVRLWRAVSLKWFHRHLYTTLISTTLGKPLAIPKKESSKWLEP